MAEQRNNGQNNANINSYSNRTTQSVWFCTKDRAYEIDEKQSQSRSNDNGIGSERAKETERRCFIDSSAPIRLYTQLHNFRSSSKVHLPLTLVYSYLASKSNRFHWVAFAQHRSISAPRSSVTRREPRERGFWDYRLRFGLGLGECFHFRRKTESLMRVNSR